MESNLAHAHSKLKKDFSELSAYKKILESQLYNNISMESDVKYKAELYQKSSEFFKQWLDDSLEANINSMADLATSALKYIIHDQNLTFKIKQELKYNRVSLKFVMEENSPNGIVEGDPINSYGGGAAIIISLVLRLAVMSRMKMGNLLLLDESMNFLSNIYVPGAASFIRQLAERTGVNILMVTANPEFISNAHIAYEGHKDGCLKLRSMKTE